VAKANRSRIAPAVLTLAALVLAVLANPAQAAEYTFAPQVSLQGLYNDNIRMTTGPHASVVGAILDARADLGVATPLSSLSFSPRMRKSNYSSKDKLDSVNWFMDINASHALSERHYLGLTANYDIESTLTSELLDTGLTQTNKDRTTRSINPNYTFVYSDRDSLQFGYGYTKVQYTEGLSSGLVDYSYRNASLNGMHQLNDTDSVSLLLYTTKFETPQTRGSTRSYAAQASYSRQFSETLKGTIGYGLIHSRFKFFQASLPFGLPVEAHASATGKLFQFNLEKDWERTSLEANLTRNVSPSGRGSQSTTDDLNLKASHRLSETLTGRVEFRYSEQKGEGDAINPALDSTRSTISANLNWHFSPYWSLNGGYRYHRILYTNAISAADSNALMFTLRYNGDKQALSR